MSSQLHMSSQLRNPDISAVTGKPLSAGTGAGYAADWALFTDWCTATGHTPLPADTATLAAFAAACPAAPATQRRRLTALQHHHRINGYQLPAATQRRLRSRPGRRSTPARSSW